MQNWDCLKRHSMYMCDNVVIIDGKELADRLEKNEEWENLARLFRISAPMIFYDYNRISWTYWEDSRGASYNLAEFPVTVFSSILARFPGFVHDRTGFWN